MVRSNAKSYNRYEKARILGARALQISYGAPVLISTDQTEPILVAAEEYDAGVLPFVIRRNGRDKSKEQPTGQTADSGSLAIDEIYRSSVGHIDVWMFRLSKDSSDQTYERIKLEHNPRAETAAILWNTELKLNEFLHVFKQHADLLKELFPLRVSKLKKTDRVSNLDPKAIEDWVEAILIGSEMSIDFESVVEGVEMIELTAATSGFILFWAAQPFPEVNTDDGYRVRFEFPVTAVDSTTVARVFEACAPRNIQDHLGTEPIHTIKSKVTDNSTANDNVIN